MTVSNLSHSYPGPRAPEFDKPTSEEDCLPEARRMVETDHGRAALGPVEPGENILIVTLPDQNQHVQAAITQALANKGAATVDFVSISDLVDESLPTYSAADGWREAKMLLEGRASTSITNADLVTGVARDAVTQYVEENPEYTSVHFDIGSRGQAADDLGDRFKGNWLFDNWEEFISGVWSFPSDLLKAVERRTIEPLRHAKRVRITDPEGTHLEFEVTADVAERWKRGAFYSGHLYMDTFGATVKTPSGVVIPEVTGVLAGTANHVGFFPRIELYFDNGKVVGVEGGGEFGRRIRDVMDEYDDIHWPGYPDTGFFWFVESALGTLPKAFRRTSDLFESHWQYPNIPERNRAGVFHHGFGSADRTHPDGVAAYARDHELPTGHLHVHNYFTTFEIQSRKTGEWVKLVDKGRITALDDPAIRAHAADYGDPDELLSHVWEPPIPGINCDGNYAEDFAPDPVQYLQDRLAEGHSV